MSNREPGSFNENVFRGVQLFLTIFICGSLIGLAAGWAIGNGQKQAMIAGAVFGGAIPIVIGLLLASLDCIFVLILNLTIDRQPKKTLAQYLGYFLAAVLAAGIVWILHPDVVFGDAANDAQLCASSQLPAGLGSENCLNDD